MARTRTTWPRILLATPAAVAVMIVGLASPTGAAIPATNKNAETFGPVTCDGSAITVTSNGHDQAPRAWDQDGNLLVVKQLDSTDTVTFTVADTTFGPFTQTDTRRFGSQGNGHAGTLVACSFTETFTDAFVPTARDADDLNHEFSIAPDDWSNYLGQTVSVSDSFSGTAHITRPGA